ncbi:MAG: hypothetical protein R2758_12325 [Bacteroidales bacterium]
MIRAVTDPNISKEGEPSGPLDALSYFDPGLLKAGLEKRFEGADTADFMREVYTGRPLQIVKGRLNHALRLSLQSLVRMSLRRNGSLISGH